MAKDCSNCLYFAVFYAEQPCITCDEETLSNWQPTLRIPLLKRSSDEGFAIQVLKIREEYQEFSDEVSDYLNGYLVNKPKLMSELCDLFQACLTHFTTDYTIEEQQAALKAHKEKLEQRGWEFIGEVEFKVTD